MGRRGDCAYCKETRWLISRGLCVSCFRDPSILILFPKQRTANTHYRSPVPSNAGDKLAPEPTHHLPGTPEKMAVISERIAQGFRSDHPDDAKRPPEEYT